MARTNKFTKEKYQEKLLYAINTLFRSDFDDPLLKMVTVTSVELNKDFSVATINWDTFDTDKLGDYKKAVSKISGAVRSKLANQLDVRHTPQIKFIYNSQFLDEMNITNLLNKNSSEADE